MTSELAPCRLFVYLAREAPLAVVLRRGPSDWARLSLWRTDVDSFEHGQWIKGRVYERRCDVSAAGSLFVAFIRQSGARPGAEARADSWLAISRPPFFTALALWFVGGTYHTGGFFPDRASVWTGFTDAAPDLGALPRWISARPPRDIPYIDSTPEWTDRTVHFNRLLRDGWQKLEDTVSTSLWQHECPGRPLSLMMEQSFGSFQTYGGPYRVEFSLVDHGDGGETRLGVATWADWDQQGRLVLARDGALWAWDQSRGLVPIEDFNGHAPDPKPPGSAARVWPPAL
jgi:hypothetical protein